MSRLDIAAQRFEAALQALDEAASQFAGLRDEVASTRTRAVELSEERERLLARIAQLEYENRALAGITEAVEGRLDVAMGGSRAALCR